MNEYEVRRSKENEFHVVKLVPQVVASCPNKELANLVADSMNNFVQVGALSKVLADAPQPENECQEVAEAQNQADPVEAGKKGVVRLEGDDLRSAFDEIRAGNKLAAVAVRWGTTLPLLRAQWAAQCRREKKAVSAKEPVKTVLNPVRVASVPALTETPYNSALVAIKELNDQADCQSCGRKFTISPESLDLCARCSEV